MVVQLAQTTSAAGGDSFGDLLVYQLTGLIIVLLVLCSLWVAVVIMGKVFKVLELKDPAPEHSTKRSVTPVLGSTQPAPSVQVTPELMAVVGAALHTVIQGPFKIVSVEESKITPKS